MKHSPARRFLSAILVLALTVPMMAVAPSAAFAVPVTWVRDYTAPSLTLQDCAVDTSAGVLWVVDSTSAGGNGKILKYTIGTDGYTVFKSGLATPNGVHLDANGDLWVAETGSQVVRKYSKDTGAQLVQLGTGVKANDATSLSRLRDPHGVTLDADGFVYVTDGLGRVLKFNPTGGDAIALTSGLAAPRDVVVDGERVLVADTGTHGLAVYTRALSRTGTIGGGSTGTPGYLSGPHGIGIDDATGNIYVANQSSGADRVVCFSSDGAYKFAWGANPSSPENYVLHSPAGVMITGDLIYVCDSSNSNPKVRVYGIDRQAPWSIGEAPSGWVTSSSAATLTAYDDASTLPFCVYRIDGGAWTTGTAPVTRVSVPDGVHEIEYYAVDEVGNVEPVHQFLNVMVDATAPVTTDDFAANYPSGIATGVATVGVSLTATDPVLGPDHLVSGLSRTEYRIGTGEWTLYTGPILLADGEYTIEYRSVDVAGNVESTHSLSVVVDTTFPTVDVVGVEDEHSYFDTRTPNATSNDPSATVTATLNGEPFVLGTEVSESGDYTLVVTATDVHGNSTVRVIRFHISRWYGISRVTPNSPNYPSSGYSQWGWERSDLVILARGDIAADAQAAAALAGYYDAPILLTSSKVLAASTRSEIVRLGATKVLVAGGTTAISAGVASELTSMGVTVQRTGGRDRYGTALACSAKLKALKGTSFSHTLIVCSGTNWAGTLGVAAYAYQNQIPVLYTQPTYLRAVDLKFIKESGITRVIVVGPTSAVSSAIRAKIDALPGVSTVRVTASNRYALAEKFASMAISDEPSRVAEATLVNGSTTWTHAVLGGTASAHRGAAVLATGPTALAAAPKAYLVAHSMDVHRVWVLGTTAHLADAIMSQAATALGHTP